MTIKSDQQHIAERIFTQLLGGQGYQEGLITRYAWPHSPMVVQVEVDDQVVQGPKSILFVPKHCSESFTEPLLGTTFTPHLHSKL